MGQGQAVLSQLLRIELRGELEGRRRPAEPHVRTTEVDGFCLTLIPINTKTSQKSMKTCKKHARNTKLWKNTWNFGVESQRFKPLEQSLEQKSLGQVFRMPMPSVSKSAEDATSEANDKVIKPDLRSSTFIH